MTRSDAGEVEAAAVMTRHDGGGLDLACVTPRCGAGDLWSRACHGAP